MLSSLFYLLISAAAIICTLQIKNGPDEDSSDDKERALASDIRAGMSPKQVLQAFKDGNNRFINNNLRIRKFVSEVSSTSIAQTPYAIVHSCIDSRVPVETIFDKRIGEIFSTRLAGNVINEDVLGGMEFATKISGAKLIVVMGHTRCGAVKGAADSAEFGNLTNLVNKIKVAEEDAKNSYSGHPDPSDYNYIDHLAKVYVHHAIDQIRKESPALSEMEANGDLLIVSAMYNIGTGKVDFFDK